MHSIKNPCFAYFKDPLEMFKTRDCTIGLSHPSPATGPSKDQLQPVHNQSLNFTQAFATTTGLISKPSGLQLQSGLNWLQSSLVASFLVLGLDFKTLFLSVN